MFMRSIYLNTNKIRSRLNFLQFYGRIKSHSFHTPSVYLKAQVLLIPSEIKLAYTLSRTMSSNTLSNLNFDNAALRCLPLDKEKGSRLRQVEGACFSLVQPSPVENPQLVAFSGDAMRLLDIDISTAVNDPDLPEYFSGNQLLNGSQPAAHCYCGHQFGYFSGQLGDGAAMYLGEIVNSSSERWEIQLKGAGKTPYSRQADGRKVLRSTIREFLCSEAMHYLGIPTTRAGVCVTSDTKVVRDIFYNGNPIFERASLVLRIAPTFLRFGSFEIFKERDRETQREGPSVGKKDVLDQMLDYTIKFFFPRLWRDAPESREEMLLEFYTEVVRRTALLVAQWQCVGWCHGVLNTDNMSIVGVTIDYGPYGFMDRFDPNYICNGSDDGGRYSYAKQPEICRWNCQKLAEAIQLSLPRSRSTPVIRVFDTTYDQAYLSGMRRKLGLMTEDAGDMNLITAFLNALYETGCDFTNGFRCLSLLPLPGSERFTELYDQVIDTLVAECCPLEELLVAYAPRIPAGQIAMFMSLIEQQPELAGALERQLDMVRKEISRQERATELKKMTPLSKSASDRERWSEWMAAYRSRLDKDVTTVEGLNERNDERRRVMTRSNPKIVLRNYVAQEVIEKAEAGDFQAVQDLLEILKDPYDLNAKESVLPTASTRCSSFVTKLCSRPPPEASKLVVT